MIIRRLSSSLRARLIVLVLIAVLPAFGIILWRSFEERSNERYHARDTAESITQSISAEEDQVILSARELLGKLAVAPQVTGGDPAACHEYLAQVTALEPRYAGLAAVDTRGKIYCWDQDLSPQVNVADRAYFQSVVFTHQFALGGYVVARNSARAAALSLAYPMFGARGELVGMTITGVTLDWLNDFSARIALPKNTTLTVIDRSGVVLARRPDPDVWLGKSIADLPVGKAVLSEGTGSVELKGLDSSQRLYAFAPLGAAGGSNAYVAVGISTATAYAGIDHALTRNLALLGAVALLAVLAAWFGGDWFVLRGMRTLVGAAQRVAEGDLSTRTSLRHDQGEIGQLARAFDEMTVTLGRRSDERLEAEEALRQTVDELERRNKELESFTYSVSHDLKEPLRTIEAFSQFLLEDYAERLDDQGRDYLQRMGKASGRLKQMIEELLMLSRLSRPPEEVTRVNVGEVVANAAAALQAMVDQKHGRIDIDGELPEVLGDLTRVEQIFGNLLANGLKFNEHAPTVHVGVERIADGHATFYVRDNGIGVDPQYQDQIFGIFQRLHRREEYEGTGAGLAIVKRAAEAMDGRVWVTSEPGAGSTFYVALPLWEGRPAARAA